MKTKIILCLCLAVCLTVIGVFGYMLWNNYAQNQREPEPETEPPTVGAVTEQATASVVTEPATEDPYADEKAEQEKFVQLGSATYQNNVHNLTKLRAINGECTAWLNIPGTSVDYPVMHTPNEPEKYLCKNFTGSYSLSGTPFLDADCTVDSSNMIICGRDMKSGSMFAPLLNYENKAYAQEHPQIRLETEQGVRVYSVYAVARVKRNDAFYNLKNAPNKEYYDRFMTNITKRALYTVGRQPQYGQKLLTLSTYTDTDYDDRIIVIAVQE